MLESVVLLTGAEEQSALPWVLWAHRPNLMVQSVTGIDEIHDIAPALRRNARLIAFASAVIVPPDVLASFGHGAYNFHPGPPAYPGLAPCHFALYDRAAEFGVTLHVMDERVDSGAIIDTLLFPMPDDPTLPGLAELTYLRLVELFGMWADRLSNRSEPLTACATARWSGRKNSRRTYRSACEIPLDISSDELSRRMLAFGGSYYGISPTINLHGVAFRAVPEQ